MTTYEKIKKIENTCCLEWLTKENKILMRDERREARGKYLSDMPLFREKTQEILDSFKTDKYERVEPYYVNDDGSETTFKELCYLYLSETDWVESYLTKHYTGLELLNEKSNKFKIEKNRKYVQGLV